MRNHIMKTISKHGRTLSHLNPELIAVNELTLDELIAELIKLGYQVEEISL